MNPWCRPVAEAKRERPTLLLLLGCGQEEAVALAVGAGCEEEGIPLVWERSEGGADELAREAAGRSRLEVGIGLDGKVGAVTFAKYPSPKAYLHIDVENLKTARWLGQAAARFVKRKPIPDRFEEQPETEETEPRQQNPSRREAEVPTHPQPTGVRPETAQIPVPAKDETSEAVVDRITQAVLAALRQQR